MEPVYIVSSAIKGRYVIQGVFADKTLADKFSEEFEHPLVDKEYLYTTYPKVYRYACSIDIQTGKILELNKCTPSVNPVFLTINHKTLYAVGQTKAEAQYNAETYFKKLQDKPNE